MASTPALSRRQLLSFRAPADAASGGIPVGGDCGYWIQVFRCAMACRFKVVLPGEGASHLTDAHTTLNLADRLEETAQWLDDESRTVVTLAPVVVPWWRRTDR